MRTGTRLFLLTSRRACCATRPTSSWISTTKELTKRYIHRATYTRDGYLDISLGDRQLTAAIKRASHPDHVLELHDHHGLKFNMVHISALWSRLKHERRWIRQNARSLIPVRGTMLRLLDTIDERADTRALSGAAYGLAKSGAGARAPWREVWTRLACAAEVHAGAFNTQQISNTSWAFATAGHAAPSLFDALAAEGCVQAHQFSSQGIANTAWAFAAANHAAPGLFDRLADVAALRTHDFSPQGIANTTWAFAVAGHAAPQLFCAFAEEAATRAQELNPQDISNTAWAFASAGHMAPQLFDALAHAAIARTHELSPQGLSNTAWAFAAAGHAAPRLFNKLAEALLPKVKQLGPQNISNTAWAFASGGYVAPRLFDALARVATTRAHEFTPQGVSTTAWAFAVQGHASPSLFDALAVEAASSGAEFNQQAVANTVWAFAVFDGPDSQLLASKALLDHMLERTSTEALVTDPKFLMQLQQWSLWFCERGLPSPLPPPLASRCRTAMLGKSKETITSRLQRDVCAALSGLVGCEPAQEVVTEEGYTIDAVVQWKGKDVAVEVDGPRHFVGCSRRPAGSTILKRRQLQNIGWRVASVPYWEWERFRGRGRRNTNASLGKQSYLTDLLDRTIAEYGAY